MFLAYTIYAFFEWALVLLDVGFDAVTMIEFQHLEIVVKDVRGVSRLYVPRLPISIDTHQECILLTITF